MQTATEPSAQTYACSTTTGPVSITPDTASAVVSAIVAAGYDIIPRSATLPSRTGTARRATFGHRYLIDEVGDGSGYRRAEGLL
jgi:hypothetical protein